MPVQGPWKKNHFISVKNLHEKLLVQNLRKKQEDVVVWFILFGYLLFVFYYSLILLLYVVSIVVNVLYCSFDVLILYFVVNFVMILALKMKLLYRNNYKNNNKLIC